MGQAMTALPEVIERKVAGYEKVVEIINESAGLHAIIALHDLTLGPALGGTRIYPYASVDEALEDVLCLAKGMTYKAAIAGVGFGGGKSVIIADPKTQKTELLLTAFAEAVNLLEGSYICAEDMGTTPADMALIRQTTKYVVGFPGRNSSGDPCPFTAWGVFKGIQATAHKLWGSDSLEGRTIAIQGIGGVGRRLADLLFWHGAHLILTDVNEEALKHYATLYRARIVKPDEIFRVECDIFAPCAKGQVLNGRTIPKLRCQAIVGAANNQLVDDAAGELLHQTGILYAPDYVINGGGLMNVSCELRAEGYDPYPARLQINQIYQTMLDIYSLSESKNQPTYLVADELAEYRLQHKMNQRTAAPYFHEIV